MVRLTTCAEMLLVLAGSMIGLLRNPTFGGVASAPIRLSASEAALTGRALDDASIADASAAAAGPSRPMDNTDFSFLWRKEMTSKFVSLALRDLGD